MVSSKQSGGQWPVLKPVPVLTMLNPRNGRTVRLFKCDCGEQTWAEDKEAASVGDRFQAGHAKYDECTEIDAKVARLRDLATRVQDQKITDGIAKLIQELLEQKAK